MKIYDFIEPELEFYREFCNFTEYERKLFDLRAREVPLEQCAEEMCCDISTIKKLSVRVNKKIIKATDTRKNERVDRQSVLGKINNFMNFLGAFTELIRTVG